MAPVPRVDSRIFDKSAQIAFAELSADFNPVHLDDIYARRTSFGHVVVHGMHIILWMLDRYACREGAAGPFGKLTARFHRPLFIDEPVEMQVRTNDSEIELRCMIDETLLANLKLSGRAPVLNAEWRPSSEVLSREPENLQISEMRDRYGEVNLSYAAQQMKMLFPYAVAHYGAAVVAHLLGLTRIVGMQVPGLHSMFAGFSVELVSGTGPQITYAVERTTPKTSHVRINIAGDVLRGSVESLVRPSSSEPEYSELAAVVAQGEFGGRRSLIVGGSRGLGLICAYMLAAGGAKVAITYKVGRLEAERAVNVIQNAGGDAMAIEMDVAAPAPGLDALRARQFSPSELYYFATPHIFERKKALFESSIFDGFIKCYVTDFANLLEACARLTPGDLRVFYPSSDALNNPIKDLLEYCAAKSAGESFCALAETFNTRLHISTVRLPRLPTDQTATLIKISTADPVRVMLEICRGMGSPVRAPAADL